MAQSPGNLVRGNTIEDGYYTGVSVGWSWGYGSSASQSQRRRRKPDWKDRSEPPERHGRNLHAWLWYARGTVLRNNFIHDVSSFSYGGWGIYPDEGSSGLLIEKNIVTRCKSAGFHQHYGQDNVVTNNIFAVQRGVAVDANSRRGPPVFHVHQEHCALGYRDAAGQQLGPAPGLRWTTICFGRSGVGRSILWGRVSVSGSHGGWTFTR